MTLLGEVSLFDLIDHPDDALPGEYAQALRTLGQKSTAGRDGPAALAGRWSRPITRRWPRPSARTRLRVPIAGCSHWRREPEFAAAQAAAPLDLIDDRLFWVPPPWIAPELAFAALEPRRRPQLRRPAEAASGPPLRGRPVVPADDGGLGPAPRGGRPAPGRADRRRARTGTPWSAAGSSCSPWLGRGAGRAPWGARTSTRSPRSSTAARTSIALWPHAASLLLRGQAGAGKSEREREPEHGGRGQAAARRRARGVPGLGPRPRPAADRHALHAGDRRLVERRAGVVAEPGGRRGQSLRGGRGQLGGPEPIATAGRLLVTVIGRVEPTGFRWVDRWRREVADPGRPPFLQEPVFARVVLAAQGEDPGLPAGQRGQRIGPAKTRAAGRRRRGDPGHRRGQARVSTGSSSPNEPDCRRRRPRGSPPVKKDPRRMSRRAGLDTGRSV